MNDLDLDAFWKVVASVRQERKEQDIKWGKQHHNPSLWLAILMEEVGELAEALLRTHFDGDPNGIRDMRMEAVQVAAVAVAFIEYLDSRSKE